MLSEKKLQWKFQKEKDININANKWFIKKKLNEGFINYKKLNDTTKSTSKSKRTLQVT